MTLHEIDGKIYLSISHWGLWPVYDESRPMHLKAKPLAGLDYERELPPRTPYTLLIDA